MFNYAMMTTEQLQTIRKMAYYAEGRCNEISIEAGHFGDDRNREVHDKRSEEYYNIWVAACREQTKRREGAK